MTSKYQRPSGAYAGEGTLQNRDKYQSDSTQVPKVAISSTKIDGDFNYVIDALNAIDAASGTRASIADRLGVALNADGTLKASAGLVLDDWVNVTLSNATAPVANQISFEGNHSSVLIAGRKVKLNVAGNLVFAHIKNSTYTGGNTVITLASPVDANGAEVMINAAPTALFYSPITGGTSGNMPHVLAMLEMLATAPELRFQTTDDNQMRMQYNAGALMFQHNTGTAEAPAWQTVCSIDASGLILADGSITGAKIAESTIALTKLDAALQSLINSKADSSSLGSAASKNVGVAMGELVELGAEGKLPSSVLPATAAATTTTQGVVELATDAEVKTGTDANRVAPVAFMKHHKGSAKAWVNIAGVGTPTIRSSYNVSSITDIGVGQYQINFSTPMANANYTVCSCANGFASSDNGGNAVLIAGSATAGYQNAPALMTTSAVRITYGRESSQTFDVNTATVTIFGD